MINIFKEIKQIKEINKNYIRKDKIREKIEEFKKLKQGLIEEGWETNYADRVIELLEQVLKESVDD